MWPILQKLCDERVSDSQDGSVCRRSVFGYNSFKIGILYCKIWTEITSERNLG
jgi:hypothetical protein